MSATHKPRLRDAVSRLFSRDIAAGAADLGVARSESYRFSRTGRLDLFIFLLIVDLVFPVAGIEILVLRADVTALTIGLMATAWVGITVLSLSMGSRKIRTSRDLMTLARVDTGICAAALAVAAISARAVLEPGEGESLLLSLAAGCVTLVLGRLAILVLSWRWSTRWIQHVVLIGTAQAMRRQLLIRPLDGAHVGYAGAILIGEGTITLPVLGRIDGRSGKIIAAEPSPVGTGSPDGGRQARRLFSGIDRIVLLEDGLEHEEKSGILAWVERFSHEVHVLQARRPDVIGEEEVQEHCVLTKPATMHPAELCLKRILDILLSLAALSVLFPAFLLVAALIRIESKGPALFQQARLGCDNLPFIVFKFRTMRQNGASDGSIQAVRGDSRITRLGALLRKSSIDELPQLLNVLNGTMSLVGPRPHPLALNCRFEPFIPRYAARHSVLPGITGWAQINGARGETPTVEAMQRRVDLDLEYVRRQSIALDLWILLRTLGSVLRTRNVY